LQPQTIKINFIYKHDYVHKPKEKKRKKKDKSDTTHFPHAAAVPKEEEVPAAQVHGQNRAVLPEAAHVPTEP
jgi:hypothetical protein